MTNSDDAQNNKASLLESEKTTAHTRASLDYRPWGMCGFVANISVLFLFCFSQNIYTAGVVRTLERRFGLSSRKSGLMLSMGDVAHISVVTFIGYFGRRTHKPRFISLTIIFSIFGGLLMTLPHFLYTTHALKHVNGSDVISGALDQSPSSFCRHDDNITESEVDDACALSDEVSENKHAFYIIVAAQILMSIGGTGVSTLSLAYVDENSDRDASSLYIGIITSTFGMGPILGLLLAAVCTRLPEDLYSKCDATHGPPQTLFNYSLIKSPAPFH